MVAWRLVFAASLALGRDDALQLRPGELEYGLSYPDSRHRLPPSAELLARLRDCARSYDLTLLGARSLYEHLRPQVPAPDWEERRAHLAVAVFRAPGSAARGAGR